MVHYCYLIEEFGTLNGLCSSITESKHIKAVKEPYCRSSKYEALMQMLLINQRMDKMAALRVDFETRGMILPRKLPPVKQPQPALPKKANTDDNNDEDNNGGGINSDEIYSEVLLLRTPST